MAAKVLKLSKARTMGGGEQLKSTENIRQLSEYLIGNTLADSNLIKTYGGEQARAKYLTALLGAAIIVMQKTQGFEATKVTVETAVEQLLTP